MMEDEDQNQRELPRYVCHKKVWALKIKSLTPWESRPDQENYREGTVMLEAEEEGYARIPLGPDFLQKHAPQVGGYYVVYEDGYRSYSPAKAFESGYTLIK